MSTIDNNAHSVVSFDAKKSKAFNGQRLCKVVYKTTGDLAASGVAKRESKCVSLPMISSQEVVNNILVLAPSIVEFLHGVQDKIVRTRVDAGAAHITMQEISIASCIEYLENNDESGRLTKESVGKWFEDTISDSLMLALADKLGISETPTDAQSAQVVKVVSAFKDKLSSLAGGKTSYEPSLCNSLKKCLELAPSGDALANRFNARLDKMIEASKSGDDLINLL